MTATLAMGGHIAFMLTIMKNTTTATIIFKIVLSIAIPPFNKLMNIIMAKSGGSPRHNTRRLSKKSQAIFSHRSAIVPFPTKASLCGSPIHYLLFANHYFCTALLYRFFI